MRYVLGAVVTAATLWAGLGSSACSGAEEPTGPGPGSRLAASYNRHFVSAPPGSTFHPQPVPGPYPPFAANAAVPTFNWGYFGARSHPTVSPHKSITGDISTRFLPGR